MNLKTRQKLFEELFAECLDLAHKKGKDYSGEKDALENFKLNAESLGITKYQTWAIYFKKGIDSILNSIKYSPEKPQVESEPLKERIKDGIIYLILLYCLLIDDEPANKHKYPVCKNCNKQNFLNNEAKKIIKF